MKVLLRCQNCWYSWLPRKKKQPKYCPRCHSSKFEALTEFEVLRKMLEPGHPPYRRNYDKPEKLKAA